MTNNQSFSKDELYTQRHDIYRAKSHITERFIKALNLYLPSDLESLSSNGDVCRVLSVGSGDGKVDLQVLKIIKDVSKKIVYNRVIEPNEFSFYKYKDSIQLLLGKSSELDDITFDITKPKTFYNYIAEEKTDAIKFDIVHFVHSLYFMDVEEALAHCYDNELGEKGMILCFIGNLIERNTDFNLEIFQQNDRQP